MWPFDREGPKTHEVVVAPLLVRSTPNGPPENPDATTVRIWDDDTHSPMITVIERDCDSGHVVKSGSERSKSLISGPIQFGSN